MDTIGLSILCMRPVPPCREVMSELWLCLSQQPQSYQEEREPVRYQESRAEPEPEPRARSPEYYPSPSGSQHQQGYSQVRAARVPAECHLRYLVVS